MSKTGWAHSDRSSVSQTRSTVVVHPPEGLNPQTGSLSSPRRQSPTVYLPQHAGSEPRFLLIPLLLGYRDKCIIAPLGKQGEIEVDISC